MFFDIFTCIAFAIISYFNFVNYFNDEFESLKNKNMELFGAIIFGMYALIKLIDLIIEIRNRKMAGVQSDNK